MIPLSLHEAVPGHHFQFARALEMPDAPMFRRTAYFVAYGEGGGLYAERLGYDMGLSDDHSDRIGQLCHDMARAGRPVGATGTPDQGGNCSRAVWTIYDTYPNVPRHAGHTILNMHRPPA